jgi:hypothetical protein
LSAQDFEFVRGIIVFLVLVVVLIVIIIFVLVFVILFVYVYVFFFVFEFVFFVLERCAVIFFVFILFLVFIEPGCPGSGDTSFAEAGFVVEGGSLFEDGGGGGTCRA